MMNNNLFLDEELQLQKIKKLVEASIKEEELLSSRLAEMEKDENLTKGQILADRVAEFGGSWTFIILFFLIIVTWILSNGYFFKPDSFDPYPFILLNLILSCLAAVQAPIIMMSQNRQEDKDRRRARSDFMVNLKAEMEVRSLHQKMDLLIAEQMQDLFKIQQAQLELLMELQKNFSNTKNS